MTIETHTPNDRISKNKFLAVFCSFLFALAFILINWPGVFGNEFEDRKVFLHIFQGKSEFDIPFNMETFFFYLFNEQLWDKGVRYFNIELAYSVEEIFSVVSFLTVFSYAYFVSTRVGVIGILLLVNPLLVDLAYSQLRLAAAMCLMLVAYSMKFLSLRIIFLLCAFFIHTATFLFVFVAIFVHYIVRLSVRRSYSTVGTYILLIFIGIVVAVAVGPLRTLILEFLGDRRAEYDVAASTMLYASMWILLLFVCMFQKKSFVNNYTNAIAIVFLSIFIFCTIFSVYGIRFLSAGLPFVVIMLLRLPPSEKPLIFIAFCCYAILQWLLWFR